MPALPADWTRLSVLEILLVDDHDFAREALARSIRRDPRLVLVGHTSQVQEARALVEQAAPHAALIDTRRSDGAGFDVIAALASVTPDRRPLVVVHTAFFDADGWRRAREAGADEWILKQIELDSLVARLVAAVRRVLPEHRWPRLG